MSRGIIEVFNVDFLLISRSTLPTKSLPKISLLQEGIKDTVVTVWGRVGFVPWVFYRYAKSLLISGK